MEVSFRQCGIYAHAWISQGSMFLTLKLRSHSLDYIKFQKIYLGKTSASSKTTSTPSRESSVAAKEPPGPPPTTRTVHDCGIEVSPIEPMVVKLLLVGSRDKVL